MPAAAGIQRIGDCRQPALDRHAVYAGHKAARELGESAPPPVGRDRDTRLSFATPRRRRATPG